MELMGHDDFKTTMNYYRVPQKRRREAAELVGSIVDDARGGISFAGMTAEQRLRFETGSIAVPFGRCNHPQNVTAEGYGCPIRHQCFGCNHFESDPSYLPELKRRLLDLKAARARADAFTEAHEWARRAGTPGDDEIAAAERHVREQEAKLEKASPDQRAQIEDAAAALRRVRAASKSVGLTLQRSRGGEDIIAYHQGVREAVESVGEIAAPGAD